MGYTFGMRVTEEERELITAVAKRLDRGESEMLRLLIREVARALDVTPANAGANQDSRGVEKSGTRAAA